jgi:peptidoglycan hydrolase-like protein with peptidoglycan-binding domain
LASTVIVRGDVLPQVSTLVAAPSSIEGDGVVTRLPPPAGTEFAEGAVVVEVSGRPVFAVQGAVPAFRSLRPGMSGADVEQLQAVLSRLGYTPDSDGRFGDATKTAVTAFYRAAGYEPVPSTTTDADVAAARSADRQAANELAAAEAAVADATTDADAAAATTARDNAVAARNDAAQALSAVVASAGPTVPLGELLFVAAMPARVQAGVTSLGPLSQVAAGVNGGPTAASLVTLAAGDLLVTATIPSDQASLVRPTMAVDLTDNVTGTAYPASITSIADTPTIDATGGSGLQATIRPIAPLPASLTGANVRVTITAASSDGAVLVVPLAAVSAAADGRQRVSVMASGGDLADVFVRAGLSADGFVEVHPDHADELKAGDQVVVGR